MSSDFSVLWRARKTVNQLLLDRGYLLADSELKMSLEDFKLRFGELPQRDKLTILAAKRDNPAEQIFVFWSEEEKLGVKPIKAYVQKMDSEKINRAILILQQGITAFAKRIVTELQHAPDPSKQRHIEMFQQAELLVNITQHVFVPKHIVLSDNEKRDLLAKYKLKDVQLPRIQQADPIARYFGLQKGQIVKIIRPSETAGRYVTYRLVV